MFSEDSNNQKNVLGEKLEECSVDPMTCILYTSDAADEGLGVHLGCRRTS